MFFFKKKKQTPLHSENSQEVQLRCLVSVLVTLAWESL